MIIGEVEAVDRKQKIRDRYKGVDISPHVDSVSLPHVGNDFKAAYKS